MRAPPGRRGDYLHFEKHTTRRADNDVYGHLNNVVHCLLFDSTVNKWLIDGGLLDPHRDETIALVAETGCCYHNEMHYPQVISAGLRLERLGTASVRYGIGLFPDDAEQVAAEGFFVHVYVDAATHAPRPIPAASRAALSRLIGG